MRDYPTCRPGGSRPPARSNRKGPFSQVGAILFRYNGYRSSSSVHVNFNSEDIKHLSNDISKLTFHAPEID